jgi:hypothetical protein
MSSVAPIFDSCGLDVSPTGAAPSSRIVPLVALVEVTIFPISAMSCDNREH